MKVLFVHNEYQWKGGEDVVLSLEMNMLRKNNIIAQSIVLNNSVINSPMKKFATFFTAIYSFQSRKLIYDAIVTHKPDVIPVHNFFPLFSPSIYDVAKRFNIPVVQTLHNYRISCPGALFLRSGKVCEKCIGGNFTYSIIHKCYKGSYFGSMSLAALDFVHKRIDTWNKKIDRIICLTEFSKKKFVQFGLKESKIRVKPNFVDISADYDNSMLRDNVGLFVGRISYEKGIELLLKVHDKLNGKVIIVGDGPLIEKLKGLNNFIVLGSKTSQEVYCLMSKASFLIFPSIWYEGFPMTIVESFAHKLPVVASKLGAMEEIVSNQNTGLHFDVNNLDDMVTRVNWAFDNYLEMRAYGENAYMEYQNRFTSDINYQTLVSIYEEVIKENEK